VKRDCYHYNYDDWYISQEQEEQHCQAGPVRCNAADTRTEHDQNAYRPSPQQHCPTPARTTPPPQRRPQPPTSPPSRGQPTVGLSTSLQAPHPCHKGPPHRKGLPSPPKQHCRCALYHTERPRTAQAVKSPAGKKVPNPPTPITDDLAPPTQPQICHWRRNIEENAEESDHLPQQGEDPKPDGLPRHQ
jgi:hypothetical protein